MQTGEALSVENVNFCYDIADYDEVVTNLQVGLKRKQMLHVHKKAYRKKTGKDKKTAKAEGYPPLRVRSGCSKEVVSKENVQGVIKENSEKVEEFETQFN